MTPPASPRQRAARLEVFRRRKNAPHPDECPKLRLHGVAFAIPPRRAAGVSFRFDAEGAHVAAVEAEEWPEAGVIAEAAVVRRRHCPRCRQVVGAGLVVDIERDIRFLESCATLAARLLRGQYDLSDEELADLLAFDAAWPPQWPAQIVQWATVGRTELAPARRPERPRGWKRLFSFFER